MRINLHIILLPALVLLGFSVLAQQLPNPYAEFSEGGYSQYEPRQYQKTIPFLTTQPEKAETFIMQYGGNRQDFVQFNNTPINSYSNTSHNAVQQAGDGNELVIHQNIWQENTSEPKNIIQYGKNNYASSQILSNANALDNYKEIYQYGSGNIASQTMEELTGTSLFIRQINNMTGEGNVATQYHRGVESGFLFIEQIGDENFASQDIINYSKSITKQYGDKNTSEIKSIQGNHNQSLIIQNDNNNVAILSQESYNQQVMLVQKDNDNTANLEQSGKGNKVEVSQSKSSALNVFQYGEENNISGIGSSWAESLNGSILDVEQIGVRNDVIVNQNKAGMVISQKGIENFSKINQK
ncbi:MAG: hypothetical protein KKA81_04645 [Bacteroidetes bacterium]|nr:hypothetical protein [Bacteroidota bacterium]